MPPLIAETTLGAKLLAGILWTGLGGLTLALIVLMRTRWGHARPLSKCVALSIYAHVLLMTYAYGTKLVIPELPGDNADDIVNLKLVAGEELDQAPDAGQAHLAKTPAPWEQLSVETPEAFSLAEPARLETRIETPPQQPLDTAADPPEVALPTPPPQETKEPAPPEEELPELDNKPMAVAAAPIEVPDVQRSEQVETLMPTTAGPDRLSTSANDPTRASTVELPSPDAGAQLQQLTDLLTTQNLADALAARTDSLPSIGKPDRSPMGDDEPRILQGNGVSIVHRQMTRRVPKRLADGEPVPELYRMRVAPDRKRLARRLGGTKASDEAVEAAIRWLSQNQEADGRWSASRFGAGIERKVLGHDRQGAGANADTGISALALLSMLGAGHTHLEGPYRENVQRGLEYLVRVQKDNGSLACDAKLFAMMYCHGMATLALSEAYAMTGDHRLQPYVKKAADFTIAAQHGTTGGWRYLPGDPGDMSQFGWQVMALKSAELAGVAMPDKTRQGMQRFLHNNTSGRARGLASYRAGERPSRTMTAEAYACRVLLGQPVDAAMTDEAAAFLLEELPGTGQVDFYYWYYGSLALFQLQDERWAKWNNALQRELLARQIKTGDDAGSYPTDELWSGYGGRVYTTSMAALCLEVYYRYLPVYGHPTTDAP
jgi:outer membrane biosynthesis protein TonB